MNSYTVDAFIIFSSIAKTVLILLTFYCPGHELVAEIQHLFVVTLVLRASDLIIFVKDVKYSFVSTD